MKVFCLLALQTANEIKTYIFNYCTQNENIQQNEMVDLLNEIMDEEFDTICEDNSTNGKPMNSYFDYVQGYFIQFFKFLFLFLFFLFFFIFDSFQSWPRN